MKMFEKKSSFKENFQSIEKFGYAYQRGLGKGAYGYVCAASRLDTQRQVAIKKIGKLDSLLVAKRTLRELLLLKHFKGSENIVSIETLLNCGPDFKEIYMVQTLMEADLHHIIQSKQPLTDVHYQFFLYQILKGLHVIHQSNVLHRDLKPGNLLINSNCELKICDFGLSRKIGEKDDEILTNYVATRWYRAPELMLSGNRYDKAVDLWSVGCIFGELLTGKALFPGKNYIDQLQLVFQTLGTPSKDILSKLCSSKSRTYVATLPSFDKQPFIKLFPKGTPMALDLLEKLLEYDPEKRPSCIQALQHPYLSQYFEAKDIEVPQSEVDFSFESQQDTAKSIRDRIYQEVLEYNQSELSSTLSSLKLSSNK